MASPPVRRAVLMRIAGRVLALPVEHVVETMRPLPIDASDGALDPVLGTAQIRGQRVLVFDAARLFGLTSGRSPGRFVSVRAGDTRIALQVDSVIDVRELGDGAAPGHVPHVAAMAELAAVLRDARWVADPAPAATDASAAADAHDAEDA